MSTRHNIFSLVLHKAALIDLWNWLAPSTESIAGLNTFKPIFYFKKIINRIPNHKYVACNDFIVILRFLFILPRQGSVFLNRTKVESWSPYLYQLLPDQYCFTRSDRLPSLVSTVMFHDQCLSCSNVNCLKFTINQTFFSSWLPNCSFFKLRFLVNSFICKI